MKTDAQEMTPMNRMQQNERERQLRKAAILVASLDDVLAERMLADLPSDDARAVRLAVSRLESIDPEEQNDILDQFRRSTRLAAPRFSEGVELDASLLARIEQHGTDAWETSVVMPPAPWEMLTEAEAAAIVDALSREHPQTVAVVISRLEHAAAAQILSQLSSHLQIEVLGRLAELDPADQQSIQVVESHLALWIQRQRERKHRLAAGVELVGRILESTPTGQRTAILTRLGSSNPELAGKIGPPTRSCIAAADSRQTAANVVKKRFDSEISHKPSPLPRLPSLPPAPTIADPLGELERLDDATLMATLTQSDRQAVTLALAGASEELMKRILRRLPRRQAKEFRRRLRDIGPTRLSDMLAAQQQLAHHALQLKQR
jgi:flagellar motor switch protein FliG